jgi:hypothetical protein
MHLLSFSSARVRVSAASVIVLGAILASVVVPQDRASAEPEPLSLTYPIVSGSYLRFSGGQACTAGLVVVKNGLIHNLSQYNRAIRYVVTAKHCGAMGETVQFAGEDVGTVKWQDPVNDIELVRIEPDSHSTRFCSPPTSGIVHCTGAVTYSPRAAGSVILGSRAFRAVARVPIPGTGAPADATLFCVSGARSGPQCGYSVLPVSRDLGLIPGERVAVNNLGNETIGPGDSGGLVCAPDGRAYGILSGGLTTAGDYRPKLVYTPIGLFFEHIPERYSIAPANT